MYKANDKRSRDRYNVELRFRVYYISAGQTSLISGTMRICIGTYANITSICAIAELRKTKVIDSIKDEVNEIIIKKKNKEKSS